MYYDEHLHDDYGPRAFEHALRGLALRHEPSMLQAVMYDNAKRILALRQATPMAAVPSGVTAQMPKITVEGPKATVDLAQQAVGVVAREAECGVPSPPPSPPTEPLDGGGDGDSDEDDDEDDDDDDDDTDLPALFRSACVAGDTDSVRALLPYVQSDVPNTQGALALHSAAFNGHTSIVRLLLDAAPASVDFVEERGCSALFLAAQAGHAPVCTLLIERGASPFGVCALGSTAVDAARANGWPKVAELLLELHATPATPAASTDGAAPTQGRGSTDVDDEESLEDLTPEFAAQARRMARPLRALIVDGAEPSSVAAASVIHALRLPITQFRAAVAALSPCEPDVLLRAPNLLGTSECAALRTAVDDECALHAARADSVDGLPDYQLDLKSLQHLESLIGADHVRRLQQLPSAYAAHPPRAAALGVPAARLAIHQVFVRRYAGAGATGRPWIGFHRDTGPLTVNVALADAASHAGGRLLGLYGGAVRAIDRAEGEATVHVSTLLHGVSRVRGGAGDGSVRWSLIVFYRERADGEMDEQGNAINVQ